ncbi:unnamed protein product, partial [Brassica oleracea]
FEVSDPDDDQSSKPTNTLQSSREQFIERMDIVDYCVGYKYKQKLNKIEIREKMEREWRVQT